jgi:hypothetical protein
MGNSRAKFCDRNDEFDEYFYEYPQWHSRWQSPPYLYVLVRLNLHDKSGVILRRAVNLETVIVSIPLTSACSIFRTMKSEHAQREYDNKPDEETYLAEDFHFSGSARYLLL